VTRKYLLIEVSEEIEYQKTKKSSALFFAVFKLRWKGRRV